MNHYERLKVSPDAPAEVIRAAYRALATKLHPDRQGGDAGPSEEAHEAMAALNASYLVLTNVKARAAYDVQLKAEQEARARPAGPRVNATGAFEASAFQTSAFHSTASGGPHAAAATAPPAAQAAWQDISWLKGGGKATGALDGQLPRKPLPRWAWALLFSSLATAGVMVWAVWQESQRMSFDHSLSQAMGAPRVVSGVVVDPLAPPPAASALSLPSDLDPAVALHIDKAAKDVAATEMPAASAPTLSNDELEHLSNAELLARMPQLMDGTGNTASGVAAAKPVEARLPPTSTALPTLPGKMPAHHHLDGKQALDLKLSVPAQLQAHVQRMPSAAP